MSRNTYPCVGLLPEDNVVPYVEYKYEVVYCILLSVTGMNEDSKRNKAGLELKCESWLPSFWSETWFGALIGVELVCVFARCKMVPYTLPVTTRRPLRVC